MRIKMRTINNLRGAHNQLGWKITTLRQHDAEISNIGCEELKTIEGKTLKKIKKMNKKSKMTEKNKNNKEIKLYQNIKNLESMLKTDADDVTVVAGGGGGSGGRGHGALRRGIGNHGSNNQAGGNNNGFNGAGNNGDDDINMDTEGGDDGNNGNAQLGGNGQDDGSTKIWNITFEGNLPLRNKLDLQQLCREIMTADSNAIIHPSTKGVNVPNPFTSLHEISKYDFKKNESIFQFFDENRDKHRYAIKVDVQTNLMPIQLSKKLKDFLMKAKTWLKHPSITYNRMKPIALVKNTKQGIHSETKFQRVLLDEFGAYFSGRADKQFSGNKLKMDIEGWAPEYKVTKIEVVYKEVRGIQQGAEMITIKVPELHQNHAMNILRNNLNLFGTQYELLHMAAMKELKNETVFIKGRNYNKFDAALICHKKNHRQIPYCYN